MKLLMTLFGVLLMSQAALANLSVSPFYLSFDADSNKRSDQVRLTNTGSRPQTYRIKLVHYQQQADGGYVETDAKADPFWAAPYVEFSPREVTLQPYQTQVIRVERKAMAGAKTGEYVAHLMMQETTPPDFDKPADKAKLSVDLKALYGITIPILIENGELMDAAVIQCVAVKKDAVHVTVAHTGTRSFYGKIVLLNGKAEVGRMDNFRIYVGTPERALIIPFTQKPKGKMTIQLMDARTNAILSSQDM